MNLWSADAEVLYWSWIWHCIDDLWTCIRWGRTWILCSTDLPQSSNLVTASGASSFDFERPDPLGVVFRFITSHFSAELSDCSYLHRFLHPSRDRSMVCNSRFCFWSIRRPIRVHFVLGPITLNDVYALLLFNTCRLTSEDKISLDRQSDNRPAS